MSEDSTERADSEEAEREGLPIAPGMEMALEEMRVPQPYAPVDQRVWFVSGVAVVVAVFAGLVAQFLTRLIGVFTNLSFYGRFSTQFTSPAGNHLGLWVIPVPVLGGLVVGLMARYGSRAIRGHGIPEAMEQILTNESRIPPRVTFLKPLSAAIAIGTGGPFGAEGPIIATGGALGSVFGQLLRTTATERKILLAAGAAAGMAATFGSPVSAVILAVELLLFEFRPRSLIPVALASVVATGVRMSFVGTAPVFPMEHLAKPSGAALASYIALGGVIGVLSVWVTRSVYAIEDLFERLPISFVWWPALGGLAVGVCGYFAPRTLGVGYVNIEDIVGGRLMGSALLFLVVMKFLSWSISLGSGTSGGTLAPLFTIGGGAGSALGLGLAAAFPMLGVDPRIAGLVGMAAIFAGASRALLTSVVFAFETTLQPMGLLPLLGGCTAAYLVSSLLMEHTIMTEKIARRGVKVPSEYSADYLEQITARMVASQPVITLNAQDALGQVRGWIASGTPESRHQGYPVVNLEERLIGVLTRRDLLDPTHPEDVLVGALVTRPPAVVYEDSTLREAADHMINEDIGRLPVVERENPRQVIGMLTRSDILKAHRKRLDETHKVHRHLRLRRGLGSLELHEEG